MAAHESTVEQAAEQGTSLKTYSVFIREASDIGTTFITSVEAANAEEAKELALTECCESWGSPENPWDRDNLRVLGVLAGDVQVIEWDDLDD